jgi:hypothetical protein
MKKVFSIVAAVVIAASFASCKKCTTCKYDYSAFGVNYTYTYPETCGKKKEINDFKTACKNAASNYGATCSCTDK